MVGATGTAVAQQVDLGAEAWESIFGFVTEDFSGYAGEWMTWNQSEADESSRSQPARSYPALRLFKSINDDKSRLHHKNVYGFDKPFSTEEKRQDGNYEMSWFMSKEENLGADGFYHPFVPTPGPLRYRAISPDKESSYVGLRFALPFAEHVAASDASKEPWISESFIRHRDQRWSITPSYPIADPKLRAVLQIREFSTGGPFDDQQDIDFPNLPLIKPALPQLSPDPADWLPPSARQGSRSTISFSADGSITKQAEQPCEWVPPDASLAGHRLCLLADQCYAFVPKELPTSPSSQQDDVPFEVGVLAADGVLKRNITCYDARTGFVRAIHHETYTTD